ncbi:MAG: hypothetical protein JSR71_02050 [Proteobacteria bacterium]|nr:hypothetical protein [Pseudomonadota bacterium]
MSSITSLETILLDADAIERHWRTVNRMKFVAHTTPGGIFTERKRIMMWWSNYVEALEKGAEVIPLFGKPV